MEQQSNSEWLEADGLGGFASGTISGLRTRKYHGYLCSAYEPPVNRYMLVSDVLLKIIHNNKEYNLTEQQYVQATIPVSPEVSISAETFPVLKIQYTIANVGTVTKEIISSHNEPITTMRLSYDWLHTNTQLHIRPLLSGKPHHDVLRQANPWTKVPNQNSVHWSSGPLNIYSKSTLAYNEKPANYEQILYTEEKTRGYDHVEALYSPGFFSSTQNAVEYISFSSNVLTQEPKQIFATAIQQRQQYTHPLYKAADDFVVQRNVQKIHEHYKNSVPSIIAGYPWFTDWGRDTFIAMRGILLAQDRFVETEQILLFWSDQIRNGLLPNRFIDENNEPEFNSIDSPLWFIVVCYEYYTSCPDLDRYTVKKLQSACTTIVKQLQAGTDYGIQQDADGLLNCGQEGVQLTWMDALYDGHVVTPRIGKPVEIQCLWLNALHILCAWDLFNKDSANKAHESFIKQFWNNENGYLNDVVHQNGNDSSLRPNQLFACGGLPFTIITDPQQQRSLLQHVTEQLLTPLGMRTLCPSNKEYIGEYHGAQEQRDLAYHQGTAWAWLLGIYCDTYFTVHGVHNESKQHIRNLWDVCINESQLYGVNGICEVASGSYPYKPNGCPWQAWSIGEYIRIVKKYNV